MLRKGTSDKVKGLKNKFFDFMIFPLVCPLVKWTLRLALFRKGLETRFCYFQASYTSSTHILAVRVDSIYVAIFRLS